MLKTNQPLQTDARLSHYSRRVMLATKRDNAKLLKIELVAVIIAVLFSLVAGFFIGLVSTRLGASLYRP